MDTCVRAFVHACVVARLYLLASLRRPRRRTHSQYLGAFGAAAWSCSGVSPVVALFCVVSRHVAQSELPQWADALDRKAAEADKRRKAAAEKARKQKEARAAAGGGGGGGSSSRSGSRCKYWPASAPAWMCSDCGFGSGSGNCGVCGRWPANEGTGKLCHHHTFGSKKDECPLCGRWETMKRYPLRLCSDCGFGSDKDNCCALTSR